MYTAISKLELENLEIKGVCQKLLGFMKPNKAATKKRVFYNCLTESDYQVLYLRVDSLEQLLHRTCVFKRSDI